MGTLSTLFSWGSGTANGELPDVFPMSVEQGVFVTTDVRNIYAKILTDALERTQGIPEKHVKFLFDNCLQSESSKGLISLLVEAMEKKSDLFLVLKDDVLRKATAEEQKQIEQDYKKQAKSSTGVFVSFKNYDKTDMVKLYSALEYAVIAALHKSVNLSKAIQFKMSKLRAGVSLSDSAKVTEQAVLIANALKEGKDVYLDADDVIETAKPDIESIKNGMLFIDSKRSFYLGLPLSYIDGEQTGGIGSTGEGDVKAVERGLKNYYFSILKPVIEIIFNCKTKFKSQDFRMLDGALNALKTFELISDRYLTAENKQLIVEKLLELDEQDIDQEEKQVEEDDAAAAEAAAKVAAFQPPKPGAAKAGE